MKINADINETNTKKKKNRNLKEAIKKPLEIATKSKDSSEPGIRR